jgi:DNA mismatch repair protein MutL
VLSGRTLRAATVVGQLHKMFIVLLVPRDPAQNGNSPFLALVDQHAAAERISLTSIMAGIRAGDQAVLSASPLPPQAVVPIPPSSIARAGTRRLLRLEQLGWRFYPPSVAGQDFSATIGSCSSAPNVTLTHTPRLCGIVLPPASVTQALEPTWSSLPAPLVSAAADASCRLALKAGQELTMQKMTLLIKELAQCPHPLRCSHGRPTVLALCHIKSVD